MKRKEMHTYMTWWNMLSTYKVKQQSSKAIYDTFWRYSPYSHKIIHNNLVSTSRLNSFCSHHDDSQSIELEGIEPKDEVEVHRTIFIRTLENNKDQAWSSQLAQ